MLSELSANSFVYCVSSRIRPEVFQVASQLVFNSVFRFLWVTLNFYRVASQLDSFLCFGFCGLHWTCFELPANSFLCFGFCELHWTCFELPANSFLCFGFFELHWTCFELPANSLLRVLTSADCIRVPSFLKFIPVCIGFSCLYFHAFYLGRQFILVDKIVSECVKFLDILFWYISTYIVS